MKMKAVLTVLLLAALIGAATALFEKKYIHVGKNLSWTDAQAYCREHYVDLFSIGSKNDYNNYKNDIQSHCNNGCWIGLSRETQTVDFTEWSDGSPLTFKEWDNNAKSKTVDARCVFSNSSWYNDSCANTRDFICYTWSPVLIVVLEKKTWGEALKYCRKNYTDLVSLVKETDQHVVKNKSKEIQTPSFWTGLKFLDGSWFWVNQQSPMNVNSMPSCPAQSFYCGAQIVESDVLENRDCEEKKNFMCYHKTKLKGFI